MPQPDMDSSSGLIMRVITILTNSKDDAERDAIKKKLEDCLVESDQKLTKLVSEHHKDLKLVMQAFISTSNNLQLSSTKLTSAKQRLQSSREMLVSKLDELRRLSEDSSRNERILALLDQVDELSRVPAAISELVENREYLEATKLLTEKQKYIEDNFESFDCLQDIRSELDSKREEIYRVLRERIFLTEDGQSKNEIVESLKMIDKSPELPELEEVKEKTETAPRSKPSLFRFSLSSHAMCFNEHYKEQIEVTKTLLSK